MVSTKKRQSPGLDDMLIALRLHTVRQHYADDAQQAISETLSYQDYLQGLIEREIESRHHNRISRLLRQSRLPLEKSLSAFELTRLPSKIVQQIRSLLDGQFLARTENILAFGNPGSGKTHLLCAIGQELVQLGHRVYFSTCNLLVQQLLRAKRDLALDKALKKLSKYEVLIIDDIGYVQQNREEMEVLFSLLAYRYERGSVMITSNLPFSQWEAIFKDPMTTAAAIDRLVHHSVILELNLKSYRVEEAKKKQKKKDR
jgi:DNA replication protein DnaC